MFKIILIIVVVLIVAVLVFAATQPGTFKVERAAAIKAPPEKILALINDFRRWAVWSPWEKLDPALERSYSGAASGPGAVYAWQGNNKVGQGRMEILASSPSATTIKLDFIKPFEAHNIADFTLLPQGDSTVLTWAMHGPKPYMAKLMHMFFNMDKLVGGDFERGLANLKAAAEGN
ncbi:polyketide cyclase [Rhodanobacter panaciterrae]|uniref:Polyketide cyclase n=1 Tax=Rhodanobacter panaciterrae TaxID=490572 RepID=A0ABQ2ZUE0_9GAMM|nr:SRPBCC family protein [Rhodanobacter panaciterrae]GGY23245.1 polyketide cyclase [Rhodanobacter panaciterrae]